MAHYPDMIMDEEDFWSRRKEHPGADAVKAAAMAATGCVLLDFVDAQSLIFLLQTRYD